MQRGPEDAAGASDPCLLVTGERWWLFFTGYESNDNRQATVLAAISPSGASWDRVGAVLERDQGETAVSHPCVLEVSRTFQMFFSSGDEQRAEIALATSNDGILWDRRGTVLAPSGEGPDGLAVYSPCVVRRQDGSLHMWYAGLAVGDTELAYRICSARFSNPE
jgi:predicted GH43/DUF377 family glycosyl hydrolase